MATAQATAYKDGLEDVIAARSAICRVDGEAGRLYYRGYEVADLVSAASFEDTTHLLWFGELPSATERAAFAARLAEARPLPAPVLDLLRRLPRDCHPLDALRTAVSLAAASDPDVRSNEPDANLRKAWRLMSLVPATVATWQRLRTGREPVSAGVGGSHPAHFLTLLEGHPPSAEVAKVLDVILTLHADHEFNASTFAARVAASTLADVHGAITAALATLKGPLHGGANEAVMKTLEEIGGVSRVEGFVVEALASKKKLMGFGHAVYKTEDPRATHLRKMSRALGELRGETKWYQMSERMEALVKAQKGLNPNVDFYSASTYRSLGVPTDLFTPLFAVSRIAGWTAHVLEQLDNNKLIRPEADYQGPRNVPYVPLDQRA